MGKSTGPKNLAKSMSSKAGRVKGGNSARNIPRSPTKMNTAAWRNKSNPTKAS